MEGSLCLACCRELREADGQLHCSRCGAHRSLLLARSIPNNGLLALLRVAKDGAAEARLGGEPSTASGGAAATTAAGGASAPAASTAIITSDGAGRRSIALWGRQLPLEDVRLVAQRPDGTAQYVYCPAAASLLPDAPGGADRFALFRERWAAHEPVIVRQCASRMNWDPQTIARAMFERATTSKGPRVQGVERDGELTVTAAASGASVSMSQHSFFAGYEKVERRMGDTQLLSVTHWPSTEDFATRLTRHYQDFLEMLPFPMYTHPQPGMAPLNLASMAAETMSGCDLGPKTSVSYGRVEEHEGEGDVVVKMHVSPADTATVLTHAMPQQPAPQQPGQERTTEDVAAVQVRCGDAAWQRPGYGGAAVVWHVACHCDVAPLRSFLEANQSQFTHMGKPVTDVAADDALHTGAFMLGPQHRAALLADRQVQLWEFEQHVGECVLLPAGCPSQLRNLTSNVKVSVEFVSPESLDTTLSMTGELRRLALEYDGTTCPPEARPHRDRLQAPAMLLHATITAHKRLNPVPTGKKGPKLVSKVELHTAEAQLLAAMMQERAAQANAAQAQAQLLEPPPPGPSVEGDAAMDKSTWLAWRPPASSPAKAAPTAESPAGWVGGPGHSTDAAVADTAEALLATPPVFSLLQQQQAAAAQPPAAAAPALPGPTAPIRDPRHPSPHHASSVETTHPAASTMAMGIPQPGTFTTWTPALPALPGILHAAPVGHPQYSASPISMGYSLPPLVMPRSPLHVLPPWQTSISPVHIPTQDSATMFPTAKGAGSYGGMYVSADVGSTHRDSVFPMTSLGLPGLPLVTVPDAETAAVGGGVADSGLFTLAAVSMQEVQQQQEAGPTGS